ncbi:unnamed protein product [Leuciscus chuanchicus]
MNANSLLTTYQAELQDEVSTIPDLRTGYGPPTSQLSHSEMAESYRRTIHLQQLRRSSQPLNLISSPIFRERGGRRRQFDKVFPRGGSQQPPSLLAPDPQSFSVRQVTSSSVHRCSVGKTASCWAGENRAVKRKRHEHIITSPRGEIDPLEVMSHSDSVQALSAHACAVQTTNSFMTQPHDGTRTLQIDRQLCIDNSAHSPAGY